MNARIAVPFAGPAPISAAVRWGDLLFCSGIAPIDAAGTVRGKGIIEQTSIALGALDTLLRNQGTDLAHVLRIECYLADAGDFAAWNDVFRQTFPIDPPARTTVVAGFVLPGLLVEVQALAGIPG
ncbi:MAG TPA: RidA family protein [Jatrophihabitantaceae bacterium]|jgi:2-iminobutanoate/2-iminopropanoate deaminase